MKLITIILKIMEKPGILIVFFCTFFITISTYEYIHAREHPFLICKKSQFDELRGRAKNEPWKSMKQEALERCKTNMIWLTREVLKPTETIEINKEQLQNYIGACALAYILDTNNEKEHLENTRLAITKGLAAVEFDPSKKWAGTVPQLAIAFTSILALDIIHDDLTPEQVAECEKVIENQINKIDREGHWKAARYGTHRTWDIYKGIKTEPDDEFYNNFLRQMTEDGVSTVSPVYAFGRLGSGDARLQKTAYADVLEFTGIDNRYYDNPVLESFYRWLFSSSVTPAKEYHFFGDQSPTWEVSPEILFWRVGRFDEKAASYAAWLLKEHSPPGHFLSYILMKEPLPVPVVPQSKLYMKGMAYFREKEDSPGSLNATLYNITGNDEWHTHEEVNAISCAAYGVRLLVNGGWLGDVTRPPDRNNTVSINNNRHQQKTGGGLEEGFIADKFDYATGISGRALGDNQFKRSLVMVHQQDGLGGYFVIMDGIEADPGDTINSFLQIATESEVQTVVPKQEFIANIDHHARVDGVKMQVFYATVPETVDFSLIPSGYLERDPEAGKHYRLGADYTTKNSGDRQILTILFPFNSFHPRATIQRVTNSMCNGARVEPGENAVDYIYESNGKTKNKINGNVFCAKLTIYRHIKGENSFYFCRAGTFFKDGNYGFESNIPVSLFMKGKHGRFTGNSATLTVFHPKITGIEANDRKLPVLDKGNGWVKVDMPSGSFDVSIY
jgi:hypothetical protein